MRKKGCFFGFLISALLIALFILSYVWVLPLRAQDTKAEEGNLIMVADSSLTYASYFFVLPLNWDPVTDEEVLALTHLTGFWAGRHEDELALIRIMPHKKKPEETVTEFMQSMKLNALREPECSLDDIREYSAFNPALRYPYKVLYFDNCPKDISSLLVCVDLPDYVVAFVLEVKGGSEEAIKPYLSDFKTILTTFKWVFGLSNDEADSLLNGRDK